MRHRVTAIIKDGDKFILMGRKKLGREYFIFIGGGVEQGETPEQAMFREIREELCIEPKEIELLFECSSSFPAIRDTHEKVEMKEYVFLVENFLGTPEIGGPEKEHMSDENQYWVERLSWEEMISKKELYTKEVQEKLVDFSIKKRILSV